MSMHREALGKQVITYAARIPETAIGFRPLLMSVARELAKPNVNSRFIREANVLLNAVITSPLCQGIEASSVKPFDPAPYLKGQHYSERYQPEMYKAALALYGLPESYSRVFCTTEFIDRETGELKTTLKQTTPLEAAKENKACWTQANIPAKDAALKKAPNRDIATIKNITLDFEYPANPMRVHAVGLELAFTLFKLGLTPVVLPVEDSGAGCHICIPVEAIDVQALGGGDVVNEAIADIVKTHIQPEFKRIARRYMLPDEVELEAFDISRIFSLPGTWRPGGNKPNEVSYLVEGYTRRWLHPHDKAYPVRVESAALTSLIKSMCQTVKEKPRFTVIKGGLSEGYKRNEAYGQRALEAEISEVEGARPGTRNNTLFKAACNLYELVAGGELDQFTVEMELERAATNTGLPRHEIKLALRSAKEKGFARPRRAPEKVG